MDGQEEKNYRERISAKTWLIFAAFLIYVSAATLPGFITNMSLQGGINENRQGIECLIQQLDYHRDNNRSANKTAASFHGYDYPVAEEAIPNEISLIAPNICDQWLRNATASEATNFDTTTDPPKADKSGG